ncbi:amino acid ABC transporter ATP-binding protein [Thiotrichales bacterium 19S9-12]|nr:amino acid ABC transporter ATP-binding protein [Thiotrichales bacterium 19S9-11]MCF6812141.1 amino acid ABC transporter ATP-binding protein [Thiotrichales bacterium 19S9-12]
MLAVENIKKKYGEVEILKGISLSVSKGESMVLLGQSGSGKSTLLKCLNYLESADDGLLTLDGKSYQFSNKKAFSYKDLLALRRRVGMVFQQYNLWPHLTVIQNLTLAPKKVLKLSKTKAQDEAMFYLERLGLKDKANSYPATLSGGQKQRVSIARALLMKPEVMLFDEPTSALDPEMVNEVLQMIADLKSKHMTMIIATHEINFAKKVADKVAFLHQGKVHEFGTSAIIDSPQTERFKKFLNIMQH